MKFTFEVLAAICKLGDCLVNEDDAIYEGEYEPLCDFLLSFDGVDSEVTGSIISYSREEMDDDQAFELVSALDVPEKQMVSDLLAEMIAGDGDISEGERVLYNRMLQVCGLPDPRSCPVEKDEDDDLVPAFMVVRTNGSVELYQTENLEWEVLGAELAGCVGADRVEVVRYTAPLNELSRKLGLNGCHLVFLVDRNGYMREDPKDNMTGTLLYGKGSEIIGDIVFALETDEGYEIIAFESRMRLTMMLSAVDEAVGGLLSF